MAPQVVPKVLYRVEFGRVWRQWNEREVGWSPQVSSHVKASLVPKHDHMHVGIDLFLELLEENVNGVGVKVRREHSDTVSSCWANSGQHIQIVVLRLLHRRWS